MILELILGIIVFLAVGYIGILVLIRRFGSRVPSLRKDPDYQPSVSIVIPTMNEEDVMEERLGNILNMDYPQEMLEVIFVDNSSDSTPEIIRRYQKDYPFLKLLKQEKEGFNNALNQGYSAAKGDIIIKSDCTAFPRPDALRNIVSNFADDRVGAVCGIHEFPREEGSVEKQFKGIQYKVQQVEAYFHSSLISHGSFGAYRKHLIPELGEEITADDSELVVNVVRHGHRAIVDPTVICVELSPETFKERREQKNRRAAGVIRVILSNLDMLFNRRYGAFGLLALPIEFFILVLTPILVSVILLLAVGLAVFTGSILPILAILLFGVITFSAVKISTKAKAIFDTYLSCFMGLFQAFTKKKKWK